MTTTLYAATAEGDADTVTTPLCDHEAPIALALGGGGARGMALIGVFKVLQEEKVPFDMMVGTSVGALGMAMFGMERDWKVLYDRTLGFLREKGFAKYGKGLTDDVSGRRRRTSLKITLAKALAVTVLAFRKGLFSPRRLREAVDAVVPDAEFADLEIPGAVTILDIARCEEVIVREGSLREACAMSANLAGFFPPYLQGGRILVDASPVSSVPVDAARRLGAAAVIAVDLRSHLEPTDRVPTGLDAAFRVAAIASDRANAAQVERADVVISPPVGETYWSDFADLDAHVAAGEQAARAALPAIRRLLERMGRVAEGTPSG